MILCQMLTGIRGVALFGIFYLASQYEMVRGRLPLLRIIMGVAAFMLAFIGVALLRMSDVLQAAAGVPLPVLLKFAIRPPYVYIANCYWNLDWGIRCMLDGTGHPTTWGFSTTAGIWDAFGVGQDIGKSLGFETVFHEKSAKVEGFNTFSFVWPLYKDGGIPWVAMFSLAWGFVASLLHRLAMARRTFGWQIISSYLTFASLFSFFALYFIVGSYLVYLLPLLAIAIALDRARARKNAETASSTTA
jgi:oligosaccharide repeat unit polymerase